MAKPLAPYPLDAYARIVPAKGKLQCPDVPVVGYAGTTVRYGKRLPVYREFVPALQAFEQTVAEVSARFYGRASKRMHTLGTLNCRRMRTYPTYLSEHAFGNAIDIDAFYIPAATRAERKRLPRELWGAMEISVDRHWSGGKGLRALHQQFLQTLVLETIQRDHFRLLLGPAFPGHADHFHFDMSNFRMIEI